ncbi:MAG: NADH-quinone oxidoreductase subunit C [Bacteroidales bacterium]|nr:NADH-quinone oxidoreductase subunit C [Bacteroidales bacterium]
MIKQYTDIFNNSGPVPVTEIPVLHYQQFCSLVTGLLKDETRHCMAYYATGTSENIQLICCIGDDSGKKISLVSHLLPRHVRSLESLTPGCPQLHIFEREIHERTGISFIGHPWLKPVRFSHDRYDRTRAMNDYPFYEIEGEELHEVGVGPVHAGIIEPGHFRFICNGEKVLHLEIHLGYQHRGIEKLFRGKRNGLEMSLASESIAGDTSVGHALAHSQLAESLAGIEIPESIQIERCIALELERIAVHIGDTAALCGDVAYQLGQVVCEALRTTVINTTQLWCGNRFGKGLVRPGGTNYPLTDKVAEAILKVLDDSGKRYQEITDRIYSLPSLLGRFEDIGTVTRNQAMSAGAVGMAARSCGIERDTRASHPFQYYRKYAIKPVIYLTGDVLSRGLLRAAEVRASVSIIKDLISVWSNVSRDCHRPVYNLPLKSDSFALSVVEGWRGEILHSALTGTGGILEHYYIKDPSLHNWMALALAVRNQEISDFPVCNKSFNLSYCGNDL